MTIMRYYGERYIFEIKITPWKQRPIFSITAIHRASGRYSVVNNLTAILSAFSIEDGTPFVEETEWTLTTKQLKRFQKEATEIFRHPYILPDIESNLDEDRWISEWSHTHNVW